MADLVNVAPANCRLTFTNSTTLTLARKDGAYLPLKIGSAWEAKLIPQAGVTLANTGLTAATLYYVYAFDDAGTLTLEASTTVPAIDADTGVRIKDSDASRTLVGMAYMGAGTPGTFVDSATQRFVSSYFNRRTRGLVNAFTAIRTTTSATFVEMNTEIRVEALVWSGDSIDVSHGGNNISSDAAQTGTVGIGEDGATTVFATNFFHIAATWEASYGRALRAPSEGYHFYTVAAKVTGGATASLFGAASDASGRWHLVASVQG